MVYHGSDYTTLQIRSKRSDLHQESQLVQEEQLFSGTVHSILYQKYPLQRHRRPTRR